MLSPQAAMQKLPSKPWPATFSTPTFHWAVEKVLGLRRCMLPRQQAALSASAANIQVFPQPPYKEVA
jgi:hypothetical protein